MPKPAICSIAILEHIFDCESVLDDFANGMLFSYMLKWESPMILQMASGVCCSANDFANGMFLGQFASVRCLSSNIASSERGSGNEGLYK